MKPQQESEEEENEEGVKKQKRVKRSNIGIYEGRYFKLRYYEITYISKTYCLLQANRQDFVLNHKKISHSQKSIA